MAANTKLIEAGDPADDARALRRCLGQFATGVTVMTASDGERMAGMSANSFTALSLDPPLVLWCIRRESGSLPVFSKANHFAVNVLSAEQVDVSNLFASSGADKFERAKWQPGRLGAPVLEGTIACMECRLERIHEGGDHLIIVGRVEHYARFAGEPLLFTQGRYAVVQEHPCAMQSSPALAPARSLFPQDVAEGSLTRLLHYTSSRTSDLFNEHRESEGLTMAQFRIYGWLRTKVRSLEELKKLAYLGDRDANDALADLLACGHVARDEAGILSLTTLGRERADAICRRLEVFETGLLQGIPEADIAAARRVLAAISSADIEEKATAEA